MQPETKAISLEIPWFLNAKNPENVALRAKAKEIRQQTAPVVTFARTEAKSVSTMPTSKKEAAPKATPAVKAQPAKQAKKQNELGSKVIRVLVTDFGHKPGSKAERKSAALRDGMTVDEYMADDLGYAGKWHTGHINHCLGKNFIKLEG